RRSVVQASDGVMGGFVDGRSLILILLFTGCASTDTYWGRPELSPAMKADMSNIRQDEYRVRQGIASTDGVQRLPVPRRARCAAPVHPTPPCPWPTCTRWSLDSRLSQSQASRGARSESASAE